MGMAVASYFDDFGLIDFAAACGMGLDHLSWLIELLGAPQSPSKRQLRTVDVGALAQVC